MPLSRAGSTAHPAAAVAGLPVRRLGVAAGYVAAATKKNAVSTGAPALPFSATWKAAEPPDPRVSAVTTGVTSAPELLKGVTLRTGDDGHVPAGKVML